MKKITLLVVFTTLFFGLKIQAQTPAVNDYANWPNTNWTLIDNFNSTDFPDALKDPTITSNFGWDDDLGGDNQADGSLTDRGAAESPEIDLTPATTVTPGQEQVLVTVPYVYVHYSDQLILEWKDNDNGGLWVFWDNFASNSSSFDYVDCNGLVTYTSVPLIISAFTPSQLQHFQYRIRYKKGTSSHNFGFCFSSPTLFSRETPACFEVSGIGTDGDIFDDHATISWTDNNGVTPQDGWEIEYGTTGFAQGSGTSVTSFTNPYVINGLNASTCYDVYIRALCDNTQGINSEWTGPFNFCTPIGTAGCGDVYFDTGGPNGIYQPDEIETLTVCPDNTGDVVSVMFTSFVTENNYDGLVIYDGPDDTYPMIDSGLTAGFNTTTCPAGSWYGTNLPNGGDLISADIANGGCLTFVFRSDGSGQSDGWEAQILCSPPITCFMPENPTVDEASITIHEATISWTDTNTTAPLNGWRVEYGPIGFTQGTGTIVNATTNPWTLTGLTDATEYCYYVQASCNDQDSFWVGPACFTTKCDVFTTPYSENFDNSGDTPICWTQGANNAKDWQFSNDVTAPGHVGYAGNVSGTTTVSGGYFAYVDDSTTAATNTFLISPFVDLNGLTNPTLGFFYISNDEFFSMYENFSVDIWDDTTSTWTEDIFTHNNGDTNGWEQTFIDLTAFANHVIQVRFDINEVTASTRDDFAIDDVFIGEMPTCVNVNSISVDNVGDVNVTLSWQDGNSPAATDWQIVYGPPGFDPDTATPIDTNDNTAYTLGGLTELTDYQLYIRANCGGGDYSVWAGPISFTTICSTFDAPYLEDFEDGGVLDACWTQSNGVDFWQFSNNVGVPGHIGNAGDVSGGNVNQIGYFAYVDNNNTFAGLNNAISTPLINTSLLATPTLYFYYISNNEGGSNVNFSVDVWDGAAWNTNFFTSNHNTEGWEEVILDLTGLTITGPIKIKFIVNENNGAGNSDDLAIDDVRVENAPDCWPIFNPIVSNETTTTVDIAWTDNDNDVPPTTYHIEYGPVGFTPGTGTTQNVDMTATPYNPYTVDNLPVDTDWDFYVYADCPNGTSYVGPVQGTTLPTCMEITNFSQVSNTATSINVNWTDNNNPTLPVGGFDIEVTYPDFGQGTGQVNTVMSSSFTITSDPLIATPTFDNIIPSSIYDVYIRANCDVGDSDSSRWTGPFRVSTQVGPPLNNTCATARELTVTADCQPSLGNNIQATPTLNPNLPTNCTDPAIDGTTAPFVVDDVWYKFTYPATTGSVTITTGFAGVMEDSAMAVYRVDNTNDECGSLVPAYSYLSNGNINYALQTCSDDDDFNNSSSSDDNKFSMVLLRNQNPGDIFYIRVWSVDRTNIPSGDNIHGQFTICVMGNPTLNRLGSLSTNEESLVDITLDYYPNPVTNTLNLKASEAIKSLEVYSLQGKKVNEMKFDTLDKEVTYKMTNLPSGTYFVKVVLANNKTKTVKIIKKG